MINQCILPEVVEGNRFLASRAHVQGQYLGQIEARLGNLTCVSLPLLDKDVTVNIPSEQHLKETDFVGIVSGRKHDKFRETGLSPEKSRLVNAPLVHEFPYALECKLIRTVELGLHTMFIGEIVGMTAESEVLGPDQLPDIEKVRPMLWGSFGSMGYYAIGGKLGNAFSVGSELRGTP